MKFRAKQFLLGIGCVSVSLGFVFKSDSNFPRRIRSNESVWTGEPGNFKEFPLVARARSASLARQTVAKNFQSLNLKTQGNVEIHDGGEGRGVKTMTDI